MVSLSKWICYEFFIAKRFLAISNIQFFIQWIQISPILLGWVFTLLKLINLFEINVSYISYEKFKEISLKTETILIVKNINRFSKMQKC